jgi:dTDP-4-amino-4,6-dideoxygalactose transaminase
VGTSSGTTALQLSLIALGIQPGDEVIVPAHTFIATAEAVSHAGATPVFADVLEDTGNLDPRAFEAAITPRTRAALPVHLYGNPADLDEILAIADRHGVAVVEDACQAHGARYQGRRVGSFGRMACFSFYPGKNLGAYGEGGAVVTNDADLASRVRRLRDHGQSKKYHHAEIGFNARLEGIQGAVLGVKLRHLDSWNEARRRHAEQYALALPGDNVVLPTVRSDCEPVFHLYVVRTEERDRLQAHLTERGIQSGLHYPIPLHQQPAYRSPGYREGQFPAAERWARTCISLPMYPELTGAQISEVAGAVGSFAFQGLEAIRR